MHINDRYPGLIEWQRNVVRAIDQAHANRGGYPPQMEIVDEATEFSRLCQEENEPFHEVTNELPVRIVPVNAHATATHEFEQDPERVTRECIHCGMWPQYHTHVPEQDCNCADCDPEGYVWERPVYSSLPGYGEDRMYGHGSAPDSFRPHP